MGERGVIIVGGGIAGIACALRLSERGVPVTLLETRKKLGGRATSFVDVRTGATLDNCQHVALGCCTNYLDLVERLGCADQLAWTSEQYWIEPGGRTSIIRPGRLPAPAHFTASVLGAKFLSLGEKLALARGMHAVLRTDRARWRGRTFGEFLARHAQPAVLIDKFWQPVVVSACNLTCERVCACSALHVFQDGFCATRSAASIAVSKVPLVRLYDRAENAITRAGGTVRLGVSVDRVDAGGVIAAGERLEASQVVLAVPLERACAMIDPALIAIDPRLSRLGDFEHSPILGVHVVFDRPVMRTPHAVLVGGGVQWLFRKDDAGASVHAVISAADDWMNLDEGAIAARVLGEIRSYYPHAADAQAISVRPVKEKRATFAPTPGVEAIRPSVSGPSGLILAGDYTDTGWPATMEGATRSGYRAAGAVLGVDPASLLVPDQPKAPLARALGLRDAPKSAFTAPLAERCDHVTAAV